MTAPALPVPSARRLRAPAAIVVLVAAFVGAAFIALPHAAVRSHPSTVRPAATDALIAGATLQQARCSNWLRATPAEKAAGVNALAAVVGAPTEYKGVHGTALTRDQGYQLFNNACASSIARNFLLYELYIRAAAFRSLVPPSY